MVLRTMVVAFRRDSVKMDTKDLRYFRQVYEERSINKASKLLFITPQGLSRIIHHLEEELGARLFERSANGMVPTESGTYLYEKSIPLLEQFDEIMIGLEQIRDRERKLKIGFSCGVLNVFPLHKLEEYQEQYGHIRLQWEEAANQEIIRQIRQGSMDIGFVIGQITEPELWSLELFCRRMHVVVYEGHPYFERESLSVEDLREVPLITLNEMYYSYHSILQRCRDFGFIPNIAAKTMESQIIYHFCRQKIGLGIDVDIHRDKIRLDGLRMIELRDSIPWKISMVIRSERMKEKAVKGMAELFRE